MKDITHLQDPLLVPYLYIIHIVIFFALPGTVLAG
jgi:hypothetical protein